VQEYTLALLKPDCFERGLTDAIIRIIKEGGFAVVRQKEVCLTLFQIETVYSNFKHEQCFPGFVEFLQSGLCLALLIKGENAIERLRELIGHGDPKLADPESIRGKFGESFRKNIIHASKDEGSFLRERPLFFSKD
jgi:nucleoside-diphosphate kinase